MNFTYKLQIVIKEEMVIKHKYSHFPGGSDGKESACNEGEPGLIPASGRSLGEGNDNPF